MKYRITNQKEMDFDIITEDGGIASVYHNGENLVTMYYQNRLTEIKDGDVWGQLADGKAYIKDWEDDIERDVIIRHALDWLVFPAPLSWEIDNSLFKNIL